MFSILVDLTDFFMEWIKTKQKLIHSCQTEILFLRFFVKFFLSLRDFKQIIKKKKIKFQFSE